MELRLFGDYTHQNETVGLFIAKYLQERIWEHF